MLQGRNKHKETLSTNSNEGEENTSSTSERKKSCDGYVNMYECSKHFFHSTYKCACTAKDMNISMMKNNVEVYSYEIEEINFINLGMREHVDSCHK